MCRSRDGQQSHWLSNFTVNGQQIDLDFWPYLPIIGNNLSASFGMVDNKLNFVSSCSISRISFWKLLKSCNYIYCINIWAHILKNRDSDWYFFISLVFLLRYGCDHHHTWRWRCYESCRAVCLPYQSYLRVIRLSDYSRPSNFGGRWTLDPAFRRWESHWLFDSYWWSTTVSWLLTLTLGIDRWLSITVCDSMCGPGIVTDVTDLFSNGCLLRLTTWQGSLHLIFNHFFTYINVIKVCVPSTESRMSKWESFRPSHGHD